MNPENLKPNSERSPSELRENARKGGVASGKARRDRRTWRQIADDIASRVLIDKEGNIAVSPITGKAMSIREGINTRLFQEALKGNLKAIGMLLDISGEKVINNQMTGKDGKDLFPTMTEEELQARLEEMKRKLS